ncbi:MAG: hypothetical protein ACREDR_07910, partial [Blastocatellia bacterium]
EQGVGVAGGGFVAGVNRLTPAGYPASLSQLAIFFRPGTGLAVGDQITLLVGTNPSGKTNIDGITLQQFKANIGALGSLNFYNVPLVTINSGDFVIGFSMNTANNLFPIAEDQTGFRGRRSYFSNDGVKYRIVDNLSADIAGNFGIRAEITENISAGGSTPFISNLSGDLEAGVLNLTGTGSDFGEDMSAAEVTLRDDSGRTVGDTGQFSINLGGTGASVFLLQVTDLNPLPLAQTASLVIIDSGGNRSAPVAVDFGRADPGAPLVRGVTLKSNGTLVITGGVFSGDLQLEINGVIVAPPLALEIKAGGKTLKVAGSTSSLNLSSGPNRVRVFAGAFKSDSWVFTN